MLQEYKSESFHFEESEHSETPLEKSLVFEYTQQEDFLVFSEIKTLESDPLIGSEGEANHCAVSTFCDSESKNSQEMSQLF